MSETVPAPAFLDDAEISPKRVITQPEWAVQRGVMRFCKRAIACEFEFASHDRGRARSEMEHIGEANRGIRRDWLDVELVLDRSRSFRCELKAPGKRPDAKGGQLRMIDRLNSLGHPATWANSVKSFAEEAERLGVPLTPNWRTVAAHEDELVASDIRKQEVKADAKRAGTYKPGKSRPRSRFTSRDRKAAGKYAASFRL